MQRIIAALALLAGLAFAAPAGAQQSVTDGYGGAPQVLGEVDEVNRSAGGTAPSSGEAAPAGAAEAPVSQAVEVESGNLPFTGLDIALLGGGGALLLALGLGVRRLTRAEHLPA